MKRNKISKSRSSAGSTRTVDPRRLAAVRGGAGLGIAVSVIPPLPRIMQQQHNEMLIRR